jgi:hypothetical protein
VGWVAPTPPGNGGREAAGRDRGSSMEWGQGVGQQSLAAPGMDARARNGPAQGGQQ